jgi:replicative DNA helicase
VLEHAPVDIISVSSALEAQGNLEDIGGAVTLVNLSQKVGAAANIEY